MEDYKSFSGKIVRRFLTGSDYVKFCEDYKANKAGIVRVSREANADDFAILESYLGGTRVIAKLAALHGKTSSYVANALRIAALAKLK